MAKQRLGTIGIYKIISPSGKVYVGQSINIEKRRNSYSKLQCKPQPKIYKSLNKYGWDNHIFEIIEECSIEQLDEREIFWKKYHLEQVNNDWHKVLFCDLYDKSGGPMSEEIKNKIRGQKRSEETKKKMSLSRTGQPGTFSGHNHSNETKAKISEARLGVPKSDETKAKMSESRKDHPMFTDEWREKIRNTHIGMKHSEETITKMKGIPKSEETKIKMSESAKGKPGHFLGGHHSDETKLEMSEYRKGKPSSFLGHHHSDETKIKLSISAKKRPFIFVPGHKHSEKTKLKMREPRPSICKHILQLDLDNNFIQEWPSLKSAKEQLKLNHSALSDCLNMKRETCGGFKWKFLN